MRVRLPVRLMVAYAALRGWPIAYRLEIDASSTAYGVRIDRKARGGVVVECVITGEGNPNSSGFQVGAITGFVARDNKLA